MKQPILSIIVPVYNVEPYLERCLLSCLRQDIPQDDYEIIVVNDGSTDGSLQVAERVAKENGNVVIISQKNGGLSAARNTGMKHARGKYFMYVDSDDYLFDNVLSSLLTIVENNDLDVLSFWTCFEVNGKTCDTEHQPFDEHRIYTGEYALLHGMRIDSVWQCVYRAQLIKELGLEFPAGRNHEDIPFDMKLYPFVKRMMFCHTMGYHYCLDRPSIMRTHNVEKRFRLIMDNLQTIGEIIMLARKDSFSKEVCDYYIRRMNSLEVSHFLMLTCQRIKWKNINKYFLEAKSLGVYPIKGITLSKKTTSLIPLINSFFFKTFLRLKSFLY
jgi:glycosyltransferase involved in cell wall biosynthesis